jgi:hypothetical protein
VFRAVPYGLLSDYSVLPVGRYTVSMRAAGAPADSPPVITTDVKVDAGQAYTVAGLGRNASLALRVLGDDLTVPPRGNARFRVIQASAKAPVLTVLDKGGAALVENARFATASPYVNVPAGSKDLAFTPTAAARPVTSASLQAASGAVYSLVVLDKATGVEVLVSDDIRSAATAPAGGVETGLGGTSRSPWLDRSRVTLIGLALLLWGAGGGALAAGALRNRERREPVRERVRV